MCELLGLSFNVCVNPDFTFRGFRERGEKNPDGWGVGFYPDGSVQIFKEPIKAGESKLSHFLTDYDMSSKIFIAHVRKSSRGKNSHRNTHPFCRELSGKFYLFAHNGTISEFEKFKLKRFKPVGETDSEHIFCYLLDYIEMKGIENWDMDSFKWLRDFLRGINMHGKMNLIFSDGVNLFAYRDIKGYKGLKFLKVGDFSEGDFSDKDWDIGFKEGGKKIRGYVISSKRLTEESGWTSIKNGELCVFKDGEIIFSEV